MFGIGYRCGLRVGCLLVPALAGSLAGCQGLAGGGSLFHAAEPGQEKWSIHCFRSEAPNHEPQVRQLADLLGQVAGLDRAKVRVTTDAKGSSLYYGEYVKAPSADGARLVFPPDYQRDLRLIQQQAINQYALFRFARPEVVGTATAARTPATGHPDWDVAGAKGPYTLQVGVFYNTPTFHDRRQAAEDYVRLLRGEGFDAYYRHEAARSFVFVGDFAESDIEHGPAGPRFGPRIEQLIARREEEFRYTLENLHPVKRSGPDGRLAVPPSLLVPVPRERRGSFEPRP